MDKKEILRKVKAKLAKKPTLGSFYLLEGTVYYSTSSGGLEHKRLWKLIINRIFKDIDSKDKEKLIKANFGADRGRVSWDGELIENTPHGEGKYLLEGTPDCEKYEKSIKSNFGLTGLPENRISIDWEDSLVYITVKDEREVVSSMLDKYNIDLKHTHVASSLRFQKMD